ncbi:hypothetical protein V501_05054 [Pseudogymnoascus sp. VKM F-4519 (FW-2642)]|nr:hypothetical protein V501_05054 [Pseudogymnoascus sp. VKM F-4519 (FW-2642)]
MALKQIIGLSSLAALAGTSFSSPVALGVRQYVPTGASSSWTTVTTTLTTTWCNSSTTDSTVFSSTASSWSESSSTPASSSLPFTLRSTSRASGSISSSTSPQSSICTIPATASVTRLETLTISSSILTVEPITAASSVLVPLIIQTLTEPNGLVVTLIVPTSASVTGLETLTISGSTLTVEPISITSSVFSTPFTSTSNVETFTEPNGSSVVLTLPPSSTLTGLQTVTTDGQTLTIQLVPTPTTSDIITATMTTVPAGLSIKPYTDTPVTGNMWLTTTGSDHSTTIVPIILPCLTCELEIVWNLLEVPDVEFSWPTFPQLPKFHLPYVKIFGITIVGSCPDPSGPTP